jgi:putative DNA primase/helicase
MMTPLRDVCRGRWQGLLPQFGISPDYLTGRHGPCPWCGGKDRFRFDDKAGAGTWVCNQCGAGDGISMVMKAKGWDFRRAAEELTPLAGGVEPALARKERSAEALQKMTEGLWKSGIPIHPGDPVGMYLSRRGLRSPYPKGLRYVEKARYHATGQAPTWHPAMVAAVISPQGEMVAVHRTYLTMDGAKAAQEEPRKLTPGPLGRGYAIRLGEPVNGVLGVAEGIETALSAAALFGVPVWAAVNAAGLMQWEPPEGVTAVHIFGDNDPKYGGQSAAFALAHRQATRGLTVNVHIPDRGDWNDELQEPAAAVLDDGYPETWARQMRRA